MVHVADRIMTGAAGTCPKTQRPAPAPSPGLKLAPVARTWVLIGPEFGVRTSDGTVVVTTKVALAESPLVPFTVTIYAPGVAVAATLKLVADN